MKMQNQKLSDSLSSREELILELLRENGVLPTPTLSFLTSLERNQIHKVLLSLSRFGRIERTTRVPVDFWRCVDD